MRKAWPTHLTPIAIRFTAFAILMFTSVTMAFAQADQAGRKGSVAFIARGPKGLATETRQIDPQNEVHHLLMKDGIVIAESTYQLEELDVIIEFEGVPNIGLRNNPAGEQIRALSEQALQMADLKSRIMAAENVALRAAGKPQKLEKDIIKREFSVVFRGVSARIQRASMEEIGRVPGVKRVWRDEMVHANLQDSVPLIRANEVWTDLGVTGKNVLVAVIDTGIDYTHPDLGGCLGPGCKVIGGYDFVNQDANPMDDFGHGTHVAGIIAANGKVKGVAPDAQLLAVKVLDNNGSGHDSWIIAGIEYAVDPDGDPTTNDGAKVINMSLGGSGSPDDPISQAVDNAFDAGVVVCVAAGNSGNGRYQTIGSPGLARNALTVGASDKSDHLAFFSSLGPASETYQIKPEVVAPGVDIYSTVPKGSCPLCNSSGYTTMSGTSMATPHVAGTAALLFERYPTATAQLVKQAIMERAVVINDPSTNLPLDVFKQGAGRIDAYASATVPGLAVLGNLSLGIDDISQPSFAQTQTMSLTNLGASSQTFALSISATFPAGITATVTPSELTLAPGETKSFIFDLSIDNSIAPDATKDPYHYEGSIKATLGSDTLRMPFAFFKAPQIVFEFGESPWFLIIAPRSGSGGVKFIFYPSSGRSVLIPAGAYDLVAQFDADHTVAQENISVSTKTSTTMMRMQAIYPVSIIGRGQDGKLVPVENILIMRDLQFKASGYDSLIMSWGAQPISYFSPMSDNFVFEMSALVNGSPSKGPSYTFDAGAKTGVSGPISFENSATDLRKVVNNYNMDRDVPGVFALHWLYMKSGGGGVGIGWSLPCGQIPLSFPYSEESYYLPPPYADYRLGFVRKSIYSGTDPCSSSYTLEYESPMLRPKDTAQLDAYWWGSSPLFSTTSDVIDSGLGPWSWYGKFDNSSGHIYFSYVDGFYYPFASQTRDERPPTPQGNIPYELYQGSTLVSSGSFSSRPVSLAVTKGSYQLKLSLTNFYVNGSQGLATVNANFDTASSDPNPPYFNNFTITQSGKLTYPVTDKGGELVSVDIFDNVGVSGVSIYHDRGDGWKALTVTKSASNTYQTNLPSPLPGTHSAGIRVIASDAQGNSLQFETQLMVTRGSYVSMDLAAGGSATSSTAGLNGTTQTGYATAAINAGAAPYGTAVFSFKQNGVTVSEAGVPASPPTNVARIFIDYRSSVAAIPGRISAGTVGIDTGIAVVNYGSASASLTYTLRNIAGGTLASGHGTLGAGAHFAKFIDQLKDEASDFVLPANFQTATQFASLEISSDQLVSVLALRMTTNQRNEALFTTTPTADLTKSAPTGVIYFPQFADGGGYTTSLVLLNTSNGIEKGTLQLLDNNGNPLAVNQVGCTSGSVFTYSIPKDGAVRFQTDGSPETINAGWAQLTPDAGTSTPIGAGVFGYNPGNFLVTESGIPATVSTTHARIYVDLSGGHDTGLAIANPASTNASITITAYQSDGVTGIGTSQGPLPLPANGHSAGFADQFIAGLPAGFTGVLDITSSTPFAALTVRSLTNERNDFLLVTLPIADMTLGAPSPIVFPQIADGGGYAMQFILISAGGVSSVTLNFYGEDCRPLPVGK